MDLGTNLALVTGAAGWLGSRLVETLVHGSADWQGMAPPNPQLHVRCLVLPSEDTALLDRLGDRVEIVRGDITRPEDCARLADGAGGAVLFHIAGIIHPRRRAEFYKVNLDGTHNVLRAAIAAGVRRAVVMSSNSPLRHQPAPRPCLRRGLALPALHALRPLQDADGAGCRRPSADGRIETVIIRAPWFYGPNQPPRQSLFFRMIRDGKGPIVGGGGNKRSMAYVDNLCQGLVLAAATPAADGRTYWIADERPYTMNEIVDTVERLLETEFGQTCAHKRMRLPGFASDTAWLIDKMLQGVGIYHQKIHVLSEMNKTIACTIDKARAELGYRPAVALEEGMRRSLQWVWQTQGGLE